MKPHRKHSGFTLVEVLVSAGIVVVLMVVLLGMTDQTQRLVRSTSAKVEQFQEARVAFEAMTRRLAQATLNTYWDYDNPTKPTKYIRSAELRAGKALLAETHGSICRVRDENYSSADSLVAARRGGCERFSSGTSLSRTPFTNCEESFVPKVFESSNASLIATR